MIDTPNGSRQILVEDDEPIICRVIAKGLAFFDRSRQQREGSTRNHNPDLVITDIRMPEVDGVELLVTLRNRYPQIPVLAISGYLQAKCRLPVRRFSGKTGEPGGVEGERGRNSRYPQPLRMSLRPYP